MQTLFLKHKIEIPPKGTFHRLDGKVVDWSEPTVLKFEVTESAFNLKPFILWVPVHNVLAVRQVEA